MSKKTIMIATLLVGSVAAIAAAHQADWLKWPFPPARHALVLVSLKCESRRNRRMTGPTSSI